MSVINTSVDPYYNTFDPANQYNMVLARAGYVEQSREFNEAQAIIREYLKRLSNTVLTEGTIINGCEIIINGTSITISKGTIYLSGLIRDVVETTVTITGVGDETIGAVLTQSIVTEEQDTTLLDPAQEYINYGKPGAHRLKEVVSIVANDNASQVMYKLQGGVLVNTYTATGLGAINDALAVRTYDEVGNYKVYGLEASSKGEETADGTKIILSVSAGRAYVKGYGVAKQSAISIYIDKAMDVAETLGEAKTYSAGTNKYKITNYPICEIEEMLATLSTSKSITRGSTANGSDLLPDVPVVDITSIVAGGTTYTKGIDFQLSGNSVDWSLSGAEPAAGSSYTCTWNFNKALAQNVDYKITTDVAAEANYIDFTGMSGATPISGTPLTYNYTHYLYRQDLVVIDKTGEISVIKGISNDEVNVASPDYNDIDYFRLSTVTVFPNSDIVYIKNNSISRITVEKLWAMMQRIEDLEYNDAISELNSAAQEGEDLSALKGVLTDPFINFDKCDLTHPFFTGSIDVTDRVLVPGITRTSNYLTLAPGATVTKYGTNIVANPVSLGTYKILLNQSNATETLSVNPYNVYTRSAVVSLSPSATSQGGGTYVSSGSDQEITNKVIASKYFKNSSYYEGEAATLAAQGYSVVVSVNNNTKKKLDSSTTLSGTQVVTSVKTSFYTYIPRSTVTITGRNFFPLQDNISVTFDGTAVSCTPTLSQYAGTAAGTLKADANGVAIGRFVIPPNILVGTKNVVMSADSSTVSTTITVSGSATFTSTGISYNTYETINHINVVYKPYDPLAQSFSLDDNCFIRGVVLYFADKSTAANVTVELRGMTNGFPNTTRYAAKVLTPSEVNVSSNGTAETVVIFDDPVYCDADSQYCIVIESDATKYALFVSTVGKQDIISRGTVYTQINSGGMLFTSSNALTWTANQTMDLKMKLLSENFNSSAVALFNPVTVNANVLFLDTDSILPKNCSCIWQYRLDNDITKNADNWYSITPYVQTYLSTVISKVQIRAIFTGTSLVSPVISSELVRLETLLFSTTGSYVTKNVTLSQSYTIIKQVVSLSLPSGTAASIQFCTDGNGTTEAAWTPATNLVSSIDLGTGFTQYTYQTVLGTAATNFRARITLSTSDPTVIPKVKNFMNIIK